MKSLQKEFLPTLMESIVSDDERDLRLLPIRDGGLGILILQKCASIHYESSKAITAPLIAIMMNQREVLPEKALVKETKYKIVRQNESTLLQKSKNIHEKLAEQGLLQKRRKKGASSWHSVMLLEKFGFVLNKGEFRDALRLRYAKRLRGLPSQSALVASSTKLIMH